MNTENQLIVKLSVILVVVSLFCAYCGYHLANRLATEKYEKQLHEATKNMLPSGLYKSNEETMVVDGATFMMMKNSDNGHLIMVGVDLSTKELLITNGATKEDEAKFNKAAEVEEQFP